MDDKRQKAQAVFGRYAQNYVNSESHARGDSLARLLAIAQVGWACLDIATGGGHVALGLARLGARVVASDLTFKMLHAARQYLGDQPAHFVQNDAEALPYASGVFDLVTCRIAPHHFPDVGRFVTECARVLKPGGLLGVVDIISPEDARAARYCNAFETLRDPSHVWAYSVADWQRFYESAGLHLEITEPTGSAQQVGVWAQRIGCDRMTIERLRTMLLQAPPVIREWYGLDVTPDWSSYADIPFTIRQALLVGRKG